MKEIEKEIIILDNDVNNKYMICDETIQSDTKYVLATKVDENDEPLLESIIFEEVIDNNERYFIRVTDEDKYNSLSAIFITKFNNMVDEL